MSHFTRIKTSIRDLTTLQNVLTKLDISWEKINSPIRGYQNETHNAELILPQVDTVDVGFSFNGYSYELVADKSFWQQSLSLELFLDKINQIYAVELLNTELRELGFSTVQYSETENGVIDLVVEKWVK